MSQRITSTLSGLASVDKLENLLAARRVDNSPEAMMTFEAFEVELGQTMRALENELKAADLARDDVDAEAVMVNGQLWRKWSSPSAQDLSDRLGTHHRFPPPVPACRWR